MKKYIVYILTLFLFVSCEDVLDVKKQNQWTDADVWRIPIMAEGVLMNAYVPIQNRPDSYDNNFLDCATDNAVTNSYGVGVNQLALGNINVYNNPLGNWSTAYEQFQNIHQFLEHGLNDSIQYIYGSTPTDSANNVAYKKRLEGEAYFLRAYWGLQLLKIYGGKTGSGKALGYPIVLHYITLEEAANPQNFVRNTYQECVDQIAADCDSAIVKLPIIYKGAGPIDGDQLSGRATSVAAAILKVNALLFGASPAYQPNDIVQMTKSGTFTVVNETAYKAKWERVAIFADSVLQDKGKKFGAFVFYGIKATDLSGAALGSAEAGTPKEFIWRRTFQNKNIETQHFPPFYFGNANTTPSQNLVDAFPMKNGYPISDEASGYNPQDPYKNRDNRFLLNICYHGMKFTTRTTNVTWADTLDISEGRKDSRGYDPKATRTGYYLSKFIARTADLLNPVLGAGGSLHMNPLLRRAEVYLAFAEAANEVWGPKVKPDTCRYTSYDVIKSVRSESGGISDTKYLDEMAKDKDNFRTLIQNERRLEFAFENHRFFDMRRWLLPLDEPVRGVVITHNETNPSVITYKGTNSFNNSTDLVEVEKRNMSNMRYYYLPLPYDETLKNPNLENNLGWK